MQQGGLERTERVERDEKGKWRRWKGSWSHRRCAQAVPQAANFLFDKLPEPFLSRYINHRVQHANQRNSPHSIIPDIHAYNFPSHRQNVNDSGASQTDEALFEVKTIQACPARYNHENVIKRAVDERVRDDHMRSTKRVIELSNGLMWNLHQRL